jgi:hypothetical protein
MAVRDTSPLPVLGVASDSGSAGPVLTVCAGLYRRGHRKWLRREVSRVFLSFSASALSHRWLMQPIGHI